MVEEIKKNSQTLYQCESCKMFYKTKELAKKCEDFCKKYKSCNTELIKYAIKI